jgi:dolichyl-phosphate beta-glucosyltransferase
MNDLSRPSDQSSLCLVVPMFNEEERVAESFDPLIDFITERPARSRVLFVDDGSTDHTVDVVTSGIQRRATDRAEILCCPHAGKGASVRSGLQQARTDLAAFCDVDLATPLDQLALLIDAAADGSCLVIGSRASHGANVQHHEQRRREIAGKAFNRLVRAWLCPGIADTQCGAKAAPTTVWRDLLAYSREDGFAWDVEVIGLALRLGVAVHELGIKWNHDDRTRVRVFHDGMAMVSAVPRIGLTIHRARRASPVFSPQVAPADHPLS